LHAAPNSGGSFLGWSGDCTGTADCQIPNISAARNVTATFGFGLTVGLTNGGGGTITYSSPTGTTCTSGPCATTYTYGTQVTLTESTVGTFAGWTGACTGTSTTCLATMTSPQSVNATFNYPGNVTTA